MVILGIETSCDETGVALYDGKRNRLLAHKLYSQVTLHAKFGGVVPELASRDHVRKLLPLVKELLQEANLKLEDLGMIAYTAGPGLIGALLVGASFAKSLGFALKIPVIPVHHMEAHLLVPLLEDNPPHFPFLALLVSGGHTQLIEAVEFGKYKILGETVDDAVGEAFDKVAKILQLPYPGGPELAKLAINGKHGRFNFPRPMTNRPGLDFSFSGLKTYALNCYREIRNEGVMAEEAAGADVDASASASVGGAAAKGMGIGIGKNVEINGDKQTKADIAYAFQDAATDSLVIKCRRALKQVGYKQLVVAGGVSANAMLRQKLDKMGESIGVNIYYPRLEFCTDNGAMVAYAGFRHYVVAKELSKEANKGVVEEGNEVSGKEAMEIKVYPRWRMGL